MSKIKTSTPKRQDLQIIRAQELEFWRLEYTRRKIRKDMQDKKVDEYLITEASRDLRYEAQQAIRDFEQILQSPKFPALSYYLQEYHGRCMEAFLKWDEFETKRLYLYDAAIFLYHNSLFNNPKFVCDDFKYDPVKDIAERLVEKCLPSLRILQDIAYTYGFTDTDLIPILSGLKILEILKSGKGLPLIRDTFLKKTFDEGHECRFNFAGVDGQFFEDEQAGFLYIYYDALEPSFDIEHEIQKISGCLKRYRQCKSCGDKITATIQICITMRKNELSHAEIKRWCNAAVSKYRRWAGLPAADLDDLDILNIIDGRRHNLVSNQARAIGLAIWEGVHFEGKTLKQMELTLSDSYSEPVYDGEAREKYTGHIRSKSSYSQFEKDLRLAEYCVENMEALTMEDRKLNRKWKPNIEIEKSRSTKADSKK